MNKAKLEQVRYHTQFKIMKDSIVQINPEFSLCTVLVAYHGDNRNRSSISKETFEQCLWTIYGIPIVGEWVRPEEDPGKETWGSHGGRIILDDQGIRYEQTTKPFGFVTEDAYKNAEWIEVTEKDGHTKNEYLKLERCILWNTRYEECDSILEENFGQSMELRINDGYYRDDNYFVITDFVFSALCILGTAEPCFESAMIGRQFEISQFQKEVRAMMEAYKKFSAAEPPDSTNEPTAQETNENAETPEGESNTPPANEEAKNNSIEGKDVRMSDILFSDVCANIENQLAEKTFRYKTTGKQYKKYVMLSVSNADSAVIVVDREGNYSTYKIPYIASSTDDGLVVTLDFENKTPMLLGAVEKTESAFSVKDEVDMISKDVSAYDVEVNTKAKINELTSKVDEITKQYEAACKENQKLKGHLSAFKKEREQAEAQKRIDLIDAVVASRSEEMGGFSEFMEFRMNIDYSMTQAQVEKELKEIHYNFMLSKQPDSKKNFSGIEVFSADSMNTKGDYVTEEFGADIARLFS